MMGPKRLASAAGRDPHLVLLFGAVLVLVCEELRGSATLLTSPAWPVLQAAIAFAGLVFAWHNQTQLRLVPILSIGIVFQLGWIVVHLALGVHSDGDTSIWYARDGDSLVAGTYPHSAYPPGAVLLFALDSLLSGGGHATRVSHAFVMIPFQVAIVVSIWSLRTRWSAWFAAALAIWPLNAFFWEFKFDLAPTAGLIAGLALAMRRRWTCSGIALGIGAALKWTPGLSGLALGLWLLRRGHRRAAAEHVGALITTFVLFNLPFILTSPGAVLATYRTQGGRGISAESMFYIPPIIGLEHSTAIISREVGAPGWANLAAGTFQAVVVIALIATAARVENDRAAVSLAAMAPAMFLLTNRVFSPQYLVTAMAAWALAGALLSDSPRQQLLIASLGFGATLANALVYPTGVLLWPTFTLILFVLAFAATGWVVVRSLALGPADARGQTVAVQVAQRVLARVRTMVRRPRFTISSRAGMAVAGVFAAGIAVRIAFVVLYRPAFLGDSDAGSYIFAAHYGLLGNVYDPAGYPLVIRVLHAVYPHLSLLILLQHGLGLATAALLYLGVRRVTGSGLLGLAPAAVVLFDGYALWVEHTPITETVFTFLVATILYVAIRASEGNLLGAAGAGLLIGTAGAVRPVALVLLASIGLWILWVYPGTAKSRSLALGAFLLPACVVVGAYVLIQRVDTGFTGLTRDSGRILYARVAGFADCSQFTPPAGTAELCEGTPPARRGSFNQYLTGFPDGATQVTPAQRSISPAWRLFGPPPAGNGQLQAFGVAAVLNQPLDYLRVVADDFHYYWADDHRAFIAAAARADPNVEQIVADYYRTGLGVASNGLGFLRWYGENVELTGILMIALLLAPLAGLLLAEGRPRHVAVLFACTGWLLPLASDAVASVDPRFVLPSYGPLAAAAAIGFGSPQLRRVIARARSGRRLRPAARHP